MAKNILVIDDDGLVSKSLCALLHSKGFYADALDNGFDAIEKVEEEHLDLIVVDIRMPLIDGVQTVKQIKEVLKAKHRKDIPVIFITGYADSELNEQAKELGEVIFKPFDNDDIMECIRDYLKE